MIANQPASAKSLLLKNASDSTIMLLGLQLMIASSALHLAWPGLLHDPFQLMLVSNGFCTLKKAHNLQFGCGHCTLPRPAQTLGPVI